MPLHFGSTVWGNLWLVRDKQLFSWQNWEVELTSAIADQLAIAIQQSQLYQQAQLMEARFQTFMNCSSTVSFMKDEQGKYDHPHQQFLCECYTRLNVSQLLARGRRVQIVGTVDPVNLLLINQQPQKFSTV